MFQRYVISVIGNEAVHSTIEFGANGTAEVMIHNNKDIENVYTAIKILKEEGKCLIPFANTPSGDFVCIDINNFVVLWKHETSSIEIISPTFSLFIDSLYWLLRQYPKYCVNEKTGFGCI